MVDHIGAIRAIVTAQVHGAKRFLMRSALNVDVNSKSKMAHYHRAKAHADNHLRETDLDYTIISVPAACLDSDNTIRTCFSLLDGDTPLDKAIRAV